MMRQQPDLGGCDAAQAGGEGVSISGGKGQPGVEICVATTSSKDHPPVIQRQPGEVCDSCHVPGPQQMSVSII